MKKISVNNLICWIVILLFVFDLFGSITGNSVSFFLIIALCVLPVFLGREAVDKFYIDNYIFIGGFFIYGVIAIIINHGGIGSIFTVVAGLIIFLAFREMTLNRGQINILLIAMFIVNLYWNYNSPNWYNKFYQSQRNITNPNTVGMYICYTAILFFVFTKESKRKIVQFLRFLIIPISMIGIYLVKARTTLIVFILFFISNIVITKWKQIRAIFLKGLSIISIAVEILFPVMYIWMYSNNIGANYYLGGIIEKNLYTGREEIWIYAFNGMKSIIDWLFGTGSDESYYEGRNLSLHNNAMDLIVLVGLIGLILYFGYLLHLILVEYNYDNACMMQYQMLLFFICILIQGAAEITLFNGSRLLFAFMPLGIAFNTNYYNTMNNNYNGIE